MTQRKPSENEIKHRLIDDAASPDAWERVGTVGPTSSTRPAWYGDPGQSASTNEDHPPSTLDSSSKDARFEAVFRKYFARIVALCETMLDTSEDDAIDLGHEVFARFYTLMDRFGEGDLIHLEAITKNMAQNRGRSLKSASRGAEIVRIEDARAKRERLRNPVPGRSEAQATARLRMELDYAIASLPEGQRLAIRLWLDGLHYADIAAALGVTTEAVKSRLREAKRHLRSLLEDGDARATRRQSGGTKTR